MTTFEARGETQRLAGEKLKGRVALPPQPAGNAATNRRASSYIAGRVWTLNGSREM